MSPVEDVATAIAASVRANGWDPDLTGTTIVLYPHKKSAQPFCELYCKDESQAKRLAEMMKKPAKPVFEAMGLDPLPSIPNVRKS